MSTLRSMTGFGRAEAALGAGTATAEVRSVNSRHLDVRVRVPREHARLEAELRRTASQHFERGQVEISVRLPREDDLMPAPQIDLEAARGYAAAAAELQSSLSLADGLSVSALLGLPGVARLAEPEIEAEAAVQAIRSAVSEACAAAAVMRAREGEALAAELLSRVANVEAAVTQIEARADEVRVALRERLQKRLASLAPEIEVDPSRLEQEVVLYVDRSDVTEETVRLRSHCAQFRETLGAGEAVGRKLEFLLQEMGREINTIGSKAADAPLAHVVVETKTELEKLREQVLNVE